MLAAYVSGHGFGHATRTAEVLRVVRRREPTLPIVVTTSAPAALFEAVIPGPLRMRRLECDVGLAQRDALTIDEPDTSARWREHAAGFDELVRSEALFLKQGQVEVVLGDVPPLAFAAAAEAGVPSVALANFSWDWIYAHYQDREPELGRAARHCAKAYAGCGLLLRLPFAGDLSAFPRIQDIPLVARRPRLARFDTRRRLGLPGGRLVLVSFGGIGMPGFGFGLLARLSELRFVAVGETELSAAADLPENTSSLSWPQLEAAGVAYEDLVGAVDAVLTKPGYGIVSDAIGAGTPLVYTERGDFPEYPILVEGMRRSLACAYVSNADLRAGRLRAALEVAFAAQMPPAPRLDGAEVAAEKLLQAQ